MGASAPESNRWYRALDGLEGLQGIALWRGCPISALLVLIKGLGVGVVALKIGVDGLLKPARVRECAAADAVV